MLFIFPFSDLNIIRPAVTKARKVSVYCKDKTLTFEYILEWIYDMTQGNVIFH